jgi:hypothetical protein
LIAKASVFLILLRIALAQIDRWVKSHEAHCRIAELDHVAKKKDLPELIILPDSISTILMPFESAKNLIFESQGSVLESTRLGVLTVVGRRDWIYEIAFVGFHGSVVLQEPGDQACALVRSPFGTPPEIKNQPAELIGFFNGSAPSEKRGFFFSIKIMSLRTFRRRK